MSTEDDTFRILKRTPFHDVRGLIREDPDGKLPTLLHQHGWSLLEYLTTMYEQNFEILQLHYFKEEYIRMWMRVYEQ